MDHVAHTALLWMIAGGATLALVLWLALLSSTEGERLGPELDRVLAERGPVSPAMPAQPATDRFELLGDPEYGLFLDDASRMASVTSAA